ncbi:MAG: PAS domain-containing sensor histidine kinase [Candidatus Caenarcaniphilales bacterium]|jgi:two-component system phosphate regulon sensor histidine kinase PhoR|nr:PAS domain-containing sensor histidine kinase [Candidatus Caenarcaniphilales bacterium]
MSSLVLHDPAKVLESVARATRNGFVAYNNDSKITYFSDRLEEITGFVEAELLGKNFNEVFGFKEVPSFAKTFDVCSRPVVLYTRDGKTINLETRTAQIIEGESEEVRGHLVFFFIEDYRKDLDKAQSEFISTVSHELRTPITSIKGFASTLLQHNALDEEKRKKYIKIIKDQAERLSRLVEDLLAVSRLESKKLQLTIHPVKIKAIIENIALIIESKYKGSHRIEISATDVVPDVWVDSDRLEQILTNLIDNAVKYSPGKDLVEIKIRPSQYEGKEMLRVNVIDYGIGIVQEDIRKVFTKFGRLDSPLTRKTEGTGLGLYISASLAKIMSGDLQVKSEGGKTTFSLYLPIESHEGGVVWWD